MSIDTDSEFDAGLAAFINFLAPEEVSRSDMRHVQNTLGNGTPLNRTLEHIGGYSGRSWGVVGIMGITAISGFAGQMESASAATISGSDAEPALIAGAGNRSPVGLAIVDPNRVQPSQKDIYPAAVAARSQSAQAAAATSQNIGGGDQHFKLVPLYRGDTADHEARKAGVAVTSVEAASGITSEQQARHLPVGYGLRIPVGPNNATLLYSVRPGDNLTHLAERYGTTAAAIAGSNKIADPDKIYVNQKLVIATTSKATATPQEVAPPPVPATAPAQPPAAAANTAPAAKPVPANQAKSPDILTYLPDNTFLLNGGSSTTAAEHDNSPFKPVAHQANSVHHTVAPAHPAKQAKPVHHPATAAHSAGTPAHPAAHTPTIPEQAKAVAKQDKGLFSAAAEKTLASIGKKPAFNEHITGSADLIASADHLEQISKSLPHGVKLHISQVLVGGEMKPHNAGSGLIAPDQIAFVLSPQSDKPADLQALYKAVYGHRDQLQTLVTRAPLPSGTVLINNGMAAHSFNPNTTVPANALIVTFRAPGQTAAPQPQTVNTHDKSTNGATHLPPVTTTPEKPSSQITLPALAMGEMPTIEAKVASLKAIYQQAAQATGVPWQIIAAIHYREGGNNPREDLQAGNPIGKGGANYTSQAGAEPDLLTSAINAGNLLQAKAEAGIYHTRIDAQNINLDVVADALFGYNGRATTYAAQATKLGFQQPAQGSPYVANDLSPVQENMGIITKDFGGIGGADHRLGALTVAIGLGLTAPASTSPSIPSNSSTPSPSSAARQATPATPEAPAPPPIAAGQKMANLAVSFGGQTTGRGKSFADATAAFQQAVLAVHEDLSQEGVTDCGVNMGTIARYSGFDPDFPLRGTSHQEAHMLATPTKYQHLGTYIPVDQLKPGDIFVNASHTFMFTGNLGGGHNTVAGSWKDHVPEPSNVFYSENGQPFQIFRPIG